MQYVLVGFLSGCIAAAVLFRSWKFLCQALTLGGTAGTVLIALLNKTSSFLFVLALLWTLANHPEILACSVFVFFVTIVVLAAKEKPEVCVDEAPNHPYKQKYFEHQADIFRHYNLTQVTD